ncbi:hypothetical protein B0A50_00891 [Salinomyces thailandicus]|uniref:Glutathione S-transferase n=1 Tax=Salinomyces thailandicus TaxID=706561 RepID=A0A4U0UCY9_9PEZI|nr:hypothetical protein B0A50_00891 [Salinomyces thailandica]
MPLTIHHLQVSQSERLLFLCEELSLPYTLHLYPRSPLLAPPEYKQLHPTGAAPVLQDGPLTLAESAACLEYINEIYGNGKLAIRPGQKNYADYLYWFHFANGSLQPAISRQMSLTLFGGASPDNPIIKNFATRFQQTLQHMDTRVKETGAWLAGDKFTLADVMCMFSVSTMRKFYSVDLQGFEGLVGWMGRVAGREGYRRAMAKGDPELDLSEITAGKSPELFGPLMRK